MVRPLLIGCFSQIYTKVLLVMRRRGDDWINATHILKAAGFDKPARTRILEREVQKETHEKVQGGYGKYQGPLESEFCRRRC
jgi:hypothetical protein